MMSNIDPGAFREFEHRGWQDVAARYHDGFAAVTVQSVVPLLDAANVTKGARVLDVACGPGYAAGAAAGRGASVTGVDFSSEMVEEARRRYPGVEFQEGDAEQLPFAGGSFDAVVMNFGMLHLGRPERALLEAHRVLRPGGRVAYTVWDTPDKAAGFGIVLGAIRDYGDLDAPIPPGPPFFRFSDPEESKRALAAAGFSDVNVTHVPQVWRLSSPDALFEVMAGGSVRSAALLRAQRPEALQTIRDEIRKSVERYGNQLPMPAVLAAAVRGRDPRYNSTLMNSREEALQTIQQLSPALKLSDLARVALKLIRDQVGADRGTIFVVDHGRGEIRSVVADRVVGEISLPIGFGIAGSVAESGTTIDTYNPHYDGRFDEKYEPILKYDTKDIFCMAVMNRGIVVGVLELLNRARPFTPEDRDFLQQAAEYLGPALENASAHAE